MAFLFRQEWAYKIVTAVTFLEAPKRCMIKQQLKLLINFAKKTVDAWRRFNVYKTSIERRRLYETFIIGVWWGPKYASTPVKYTAQKIKFSMKDFFSKCDIYWFGHIY